MSGNATNVIKNRSPDRILVLRKIEGKGTLTDQGLVDNRLFSGGNRLHAILEPETCHWYFKYEAGALPQSLQQKFTTFTKLMSFANNYFNRRNIEITEVID
jgi:hypothetical protein